MEKKPEIVPPRIEDIILKPQQTEAEEEELRVWEEEGLEKDDVYADYLDLVEQRRIAASGKKKVVK